MNKWIVVVLFLICVLISSFSQIILKTSATSDKKGIYFWLNKKVIIGYALFFMVFMGTTMLYRYIDLSLGTLLDCAGYIYIPILSCVILKERINKRQIVGILLIIFGIVVGTIV